MRKTVSGDKKLDQLCINTIRFLAIEAIQKALSGHPGIALEIAPLLYTLFGEVMRYSSANPRWFNRDRLVLSAGHGAPALYAIMALCEFFRVEEILKLRQFGSLTPGHPEYGLTPGIEATTGPLGQGVGMSVGMAIAQKIAAAYFNRPGYEIIDYLVYCIASDGDLMEGVSYESPRLKSWFHSSTSCA